uniref:Uncharacterized protein n=1 Tax=Ascaris lumbricoides TaxID=6252 RepID=A0A0M3IJK3_ASCLU
MEESNDFLAPPINMHTSEALFILSPITELTRNS